MMSEAERLKHIEKNKAQNVRYHRERREFDATRTKVEIEDQLKAAEYEKLWIKTRQEKYRLLHHLAVDRLTDSMHDRLMKLRREMERMRI
jgi:hypothetical protein